MSGLVELHDAGTGDIVGLYNADGLRVGDWCDRTGRALLGSSFYVRKSACRNVMNEAYAFECSECGCTVAGGDELGHDSSEGEFRFCPNCGAKVVAE